MTTAAPEKPATVPAGSVRCNRGQLVAAMTAAASIVPTRAHQPVLSCVRIVSNAESTSVECRGNDFSSLKMALGLVQCESAMDVYAPAAHLLSVARAMTGETVILRHEDGILTVSDDDSSFELACAVGEFPQAGVGASEIAKTTGKQLLRLIRQVGFAVNTEGNRYAMNSLCLVVRSGWISAIATDGHRLAKADTEFAGKRKEQQSLIAPTVLTVLPRILDDEDEVTISIGESVACFKSDGFSASFPLIEGTFPPYADVIPGDLPNLASVASDSFVDAADRGALLAEAREDTLICDFGKHGVKFSMRSANGKSAVSYPCKFEGDPVRIGFRAKYLQDAMKHAEAEEVKIRLDAANRPIKVEATNYVCVVMPQNIRE
jgi:DNA polymerase-3 subunit beta